MKSALASLSAALLVLTTATACADSALHEDVRAIRAATISLVDAIRAAEAHGEGGIAYQAEIDSDAFAPTYEVKVVRGDDRWEIDISAVDGSILRERRDD